MGNRSGCILVILVAIMLCNLAGIYFIIDSHSRFTTALAENTETLSHINDRLNNLSVASFNSNNSTNTITTTVSEFANLEFRQPEAQSGGTRVYSISTFSGNLNYLIRNESSTSMVWNICNDDIAERNLMQVMEWQPKIAESWDISKDGLTYTIHLRKNVTWHPYTDPVTKKKIPSRPVTAGDFVFWWECIQNPDIPCDPLRTYFTSVKSIDKIDDYTLRIIWKEPYSLIESHTLGLSPLPRHYFRPDPKMTDKQFAEYLKTTPRNQFVVGCGPYRLAEWKQNESMTFERYEDYYGPKPYVKKLIYRVIPEINVQLVELKKGGISDMSLYPEQWVKETPEPQFKIVTPDIENVIEDSAQWDDLKAAGKTPSDYSLEKYQYLTASTGWQYIGYNMRNPLFADRKVRTALTMLTDRERILKEVYLGFGKIMAGPFVAACPYYDPDIKPIPYDTEGAKKLLAEAGWKDTDNDGILDKDINGDGKREKFSFTLLFNNTNPMRRKYSAILQADLKKAGIDMNINPLEWSVFLQKIEEQSFEACALGWTGVLEPDPFQVWHGSQADKKASSNHVGFKNAEADRLIEEGRKTLDTKKRTEIYRQFYRLLHKEQPYTFLLSGVRLIAQKKEFRNARVYKLRMEDNLQWLPQAGEQ